MPTLTALLGLLRSALADRQRLLLENAALRHQVAVLTFGLSGTAAHFHNSAGGIEVVLSGGPTVWSGVSLPMSAGQVADMQTGTWYVNVHTVANPNGEIRGALLPRSACVRGHAARRRGFTGSPWLRSSSRKSKGLPGCWAVLFARAVVEHPAGCGSLLAHVGVSAAAFRGSKALGIRDVIGFGAAWPTAHALACLRINAPVAGDAARLATDPGGLTPDRAGFAPAGRRSGFPELIASFIPPWPAGPGRNWSSYPLTPTRMDNMFPMQNLTFLTFLVSLAVTGCRAIEGVPVEVPRARATSQAPPLWVASRETGETVTIPLGKTLERSAGCDVLFEYDFSNHISWQGESRSFVAPALEAGSRVGYGFLYFTGKTHDALRKEILFLVADYDSERARLFVDTNNNLDLTDDKPACVEEENGSFLIHLHDLEKPDQRFSVRLLSYRGREKEAEVYAEILTSNIRRMGGKTTKPKFWFEEQRLNIQAGEAKVGDLSFSIGIHDYDCNGNYADRKIDRVLVAQSGQLGISVKLSDGAVVFEEETLFSVQGKAFEIVEIDPAGRFLEIRQSEKQLRQRLGPGMSLPVLSLERLDGGKSELVFYLKAKHYLLLDFWGSWCAPCVAEIPKTKELQGKWKDRLVILGLHYGDAKAARDLVEKKGISWDQAVATEEIRERFLVDGWPTYVLVDPNGKIMRMDIELVEVDSLLLELDKKD